MRFEFIGRAPSYGRNAPIIPKSCLGSEGLAMMSAAMASSDTIRTVAVLGAGTMGKGVAHVFARAGYNVILRDVEQRFLDRGLETIAKNLDREVKKQKITDADKSATLAHLRPTTDMAALAAADFAVEAVPEQLELKTRVLK